MFSNAKIGDKVWSIRSGWTEITEIGGNDYYPINIKGIMYSLDGKLWNFDTSPSLFWKEQKFDLSKPLPDFKRGDILWVWDCDREYKILRVFSHFDDDTICVFLGGTYCGNTIDYKNAEKAIQ